MTTTDSTTPPPSDEARAPAREIDWRRRARQYAIVAAVSLVVGLGAVVTAVVVIAVNQPTAQVAADRCGTLSELALLIESSTSSGVQRGPEAAVLGNTLAGIDGAGKDIQFDAAVTAAADAYAADANQITLSVLSNAVAFDQDQGGCSTP